MARNERGRRGGRGSNQYVTRPAASGGDDAQMARVTAMRGHGMPPAIAEGGQTVLSRVAGGDAMMSEGRAVLEPHVYRTALRSRPGRGLTAHACGGELDESRLSRELETAVPVQRGDEEMHRLRCRLAAATLVAAREPEYAGSDGVYDRVEETRQSMIEDRLRHLGLPA